MPHISVKLRQGYSRARKTRLSAALTITIVEALDCPTFDVSVGIEDVAPEEWADRVYEPDIAAKSKTIYKRPGYAPPR